MICVVVEVVERDMDFDHPKSSRLAYSSSTGGAWEPGDLLSLPTAIDQLVMVVLAYVSMKVCEALRRDTLLAPRVLIKQSARSEPGLRFAGLTVSEFSNAPPLRPFRITRSPRS